MDIPTAETLVAHYEDFCRRHDMAETRFGRDATGEPQLIASIRSGRSPSLKVLHRVASFMADYDRKASDDSAAPSISATSAESQTTSANNEQENICSETIAADWPCVERPAA